MKLLQMIVLARLKRQKIRLAFVLLAIAASSCLIVWIVGGYQSLFTEAMNEENNSESSYDLRIGTLPSSGFNRGMRNSQGSFGGPFAQQTLKPQKNNESQSLKRNPERISNLKKDRFEYARSNDGRIEIAKTKEKVPSHILEKLQLIDQNNDGFLDCNEEKKMSMNRQPIKELGETANDSGKFRGMPNERGGMSSGMRSDFGTTPSIPENLIADIKADSAVIRCDETAIVRGFVYSKRTPNVLQPSNDNNSNILKKVDNESIIEKKSTQVTAEEISKESLFSTAPEGIDPELHQNGLAAYRAALGTPLAMGATFLGTTAKEPPFEIKEGKWLQQNAEALETVLTSNGAKHWNVKPGDDLLVITKSTEFQLKIIGIVADPYSNGFYVSKPLAEKIAATKLMTQSLGLKIRISTDDFRKKWEKRIQNEVPGLKIQTEKEFAAQKEEENQQQNNLFQYQAMSGTLLAVLAAIFIIFTTLNMSIQEQKRQIALYRMIGLTRSQISMSILIESLILAIPGWFGGLITGWLLLYWNTGKVMDLNLKMIGISFFAAVLGAIFAAFYPMIQAARIKPLDAIHQGSNPFRFKTSPPKRTLLFCGSALLGGLFVSVDLYLIYFLPMPTAQKAMLHSGIGIFFLTLGTLFLIPILIKGTEFIFVPIFAKLFRFDSVFLKNELSGNLGRTTAVTVLLSLGGGLFVSMQIWGYSMLGPFLPSQGMPECFVAFMPIELEKESVLELKNIRGIKQNEFLSMVIEQAAFADDSISSEKGMGAQFANVVFFGVDVDKGLDGPRPMIDLHFIQGKRKDAIQALKTNRGVIITDSIAIDYGLNVGNSLKVVSPQNSSLTFEYPIVGVVSFPGWQWLSKTGGVRRNFARSGGIVFANKNDIMTDYQRQDRQFFWFNTDGSRSYSEMENDLDRLAQKNLKMIQPEKGSKTKGLTAYVKLSTRDSLYNSIKNRADNVIWGLSKMPLITLIITSIAVIGAITNSVRSRRWQFGIMRAIGITRQAILRMICIEALLIGIVASLTSFLFGFVAALGALKLGKSIFGSLDPPLILPVQGLFIGFCLTLLLCAIAAIYPALTTALKQPFQLLQEGREIN
ncbi:MAG: FtsX-like permease family protein [Planctomycetia bacterium]|nr:FtsX-like permease family protein [Planctomycetia bacterium]